MALKTIKELEVEFKEIHKRCVDETRVEGKATYLSHGARCEALASLNTLKDVLELIDEIEEGEDLISGKMLLISKTELKKRING